MREPHTEPVRADWWTTGAARVNASAAWEQALRDCYLDWELTKSVGSNFKAEIRQRPLSEIRLVECHCGPCSGRRVLRQTNKEGEPFVGIQVVVGGGERFRIGKQVISVSEGDLVFWNSYEATEFEVVEDLHKITLLMPQSLLESRLEMGMLIRGGVVNKSTATGAMLYSHIRALACQFDAISEREVFGIKWSSIELGAATALGLQQPIISPSKEHTRRIQKYILAELQNPELCIQKIADDNGISVRYVHSLFACQGCTISQWIMERRLERCRDALGARRDGRGVVKDVAFQGGFNDTAHFTRVFKKRCEQKPLEFWISTHPTCENSYDVFKAPRPVE